jgi:hypothetical protein
MIHERETGFGSGLRAQLERKQGGDEPVVEAELPETSVEPLGDLVQLVADEPAAASEVAAVQAELEAAIRREQELRDALQHQVEAYERELAADRDLAVREAEFEQRAARLETARAELEEQQVVLRIQSDQIESERSELVAKRTELVAEEARIDQLATHIDSRSHDLRSDDQDRAQAGAHIAQQLAAIGERERELKRERAAHDARRQEAEARLAAREQGVRELDVAALRRERAVAERELVMQAAAAEAARDRTRLQERAEAVAAREDALERTGDARAQMLVNGEAALAAWEKRLREQGERLDRERAGHGQASQEAFALLSELEQREEQVGRRETQLLMAEAAFSERSAQLGLAEDDIRLREARLGADLDLREDKLDERERLLAEREQLVGDRDRDLTAYVGEIQGQFSQRSVA